MVYKQQYDKLRLASLKQYIDFKARDDNWILGPKLRAKFKSLQVEGICVEKRIFLEKHDDCRRQGVLGCRSYCSSRGQSFEKSYSWFYICTNIESLIFRCQSIYGIILLINKLVPHAGKGITTFFELVRLSHQELFCGQQGTEINYPSSSKSSIPSNSLANIPKTSST